MVSSLMPASVIAFAHVLCSHVRLFFPHNFLFYLFVFLVVDFFFFLLLIISQLRISYIPTVSIVKTFFVVHCC
jgi:hypothetical protein